MNFCYQCGCDLTNGYYIPVRLNGNRCSLFHRICRDCGDNLLQMVGMPLRVKKDDGSWETICEELSCPACNSKCQRLDFVGAEGIPNELIRECPVCLEAKRGNFYNPIGDDGSSCHASHSVCETCAKSMYLASLLPGAPDLSCGVCRKEFIVVFADIDREFLGFQFIRDTFDVKFNHIGFESDFM